MTRKQYIQKAAALLAAPLMLLAGCAVEEKDGATLSGAEDALRLAAAATVSAYTAATDETTDPAASTRTVSGKDSWTGDGTETFGVCLSHTTADSYGQYKITGASGSVEAATDDTGYDYSAYWQATGTSTLKAWYPYSLAPIDTSTGVAAPATISISAQGTSDGFAACDYLVAASQTVTYGSTAPTVTFTHAMAKLRIDVVTPSGYAAHIVSALITGCYNQVQLNSTLDAIEPVTTTTGSITPCADTDDTSDATTNYFAAYEALLAPGTIPDDAVIYISTDDKTYSFSLSGTLEAGKTLTQKLYIGWSNIIDLSEQTATDGTITITTNNAILTGNSEYKVVIADNVSTLVLKDFEITNQLEFQGPTTLYLMGTNSVTTSSNYRSAILFSGEGTLTIDGTDTDELTATASGDYAGGIDLMGNNANLEIKGGEIKAEGGWGAAGIGNGINSSCGNITIKGGNVTGIGGYDGAGIGSGRYSSCGDITILGGKVYATTYVSGSNASAGIGSGYYGSCENISISGGTVTAISELYGAAIGTGNSDGTCKSIVISGTAKVRIKGANCDIGSYKSNQCGSITIYSTADITKIDGGEVSYNPDPEYLN